MLRTWAGALLRELGLRRDGQRAKEGRDSEVGVVPAAAPTSSATAAAAAASEAARDRFSHRGGLRTEAEAQGRARDIRRSPSRGREDAGGRPPSPAPISSDPRPRF